jgi:hypothetical protein
MFIHSSEKFENKKSSDLTEHINTTTQCVCASMKTNESAVRAILKEIFLYVSCYVSTCLELKTKQRGLSPQAAAACW